MAREINYRKETLYTKAVTNSRMAHKTLAMVPDYSAVSCYFSILFQVLQVGNI